MAANDLSLSINVRSTPSMNGAILVGANHPVSVYRNYIVNPFAPEVLER